MNVTLTSITTRAPGPCLQQSHSYVEENVKSHSSDYNKRQQIVRSCMFFKIFVGQVL
uniref:Uncharacterized protein n=1 Tax=Arundo donax TaxID=35708 RepID=A0A0A9G4F6_ARUDO